MAKAQEVDKDLRRVTLGEVSTIRQRIMRAGLSFESVASACYFQYRSHHYFRFKATWFSFYSLVRGTSRRRDVYRLVKSYLDEQDLSEQVMSDRNMRRVA